MISLLKGLFRQVKVEYKKPIGITREASSMQTILEIHPNEWVNKRNFMAAGIYNPGRAKSTLVRKHDKLILCKRENNQSYWMLITNATEAKNNMTEKDIKKFVVYVC